MTNLSTKACCSRLRLTKQAAAQQITADSAVHQLVMQARVRFESTDKMVTRRLT